MKNLIALILAISVVLTIGITALADDTGIQIIGGPAASEEEESVNLDDFKVGDVAHIAGLGDVSIENVGFYYELSLSDKDGRYYSAIESGDEAQYLVVDVRIINTTKSNKDYLSKITDISCEYGDGYIFAGWVRQYKSDNINGRLYDKKDLSYEIKQLYAGCYAIVVTLPNLCVDSKEPLSVTFTIGDSEFTYNHRK